MRTIVAGLVILLVLGLPACGVWERTVGQITGFSRICVDGVLYYQFPSGASVAYTPEGKVRAC